MFKKFINWLKSLFRKTKKMEIISNVDSTRFEHNGKTYPKIYQPILQGENRVGIYSVYVRNQLITSAHYTDYTVNGISYGSALLLMAALVNIVWIPKNTSITIVNQGGGTGGGGIGSANQDIDVNRSINIAAGAVLTINDRNNNPIAYYSGTGFGFQVSSIKSISETLPFFSAIRPVSIALTTDPTGVYARTIISSGNGLYFSDGTNWVKLNNSGDVFDGETIVQNYFQWVANDENTGIFFDAQNAYLEFRGGTEVGNRVSLILGEDYAALAGGGISDLKIQAVGEGALITKGYFDRNQTGGGGLTTNQLNRLNNTNLFFNDEKEVDFDFGAEDEEVSSGANIGRKTRTFVAGANEVTGTIRTTSVSLGSSVLLDTDSATAIYNIRASAADGQILIGEGLTEGQGARLTGGVLRASLYRINSTTVRIDGSYEGYNDVIEIHTQANAASDPNGNEANATTGWSLGTGTTAAPTLTSDADSDTGDYSLKVMNTLTGSSYMRYYFGVTAGEIFRVKWNAKSTQGSNAYATAWQNCTGGPNFDPPGVDGGSKSVWAAQGDSGNGYLITATATGSIELRFYGSSSAGGVNGDNYFVDNLSIVKIS